MMPPHRCDFRSPERLAEVWGDFLPDINDAVGVDERKNESIMMNKKKNEEDTKIITTEVITPEFSILWG